MVLRKLVIANLIVHRVRAILTIAAIALSVSLVVSVSSGYSSAQGAARKLLSQYMSACDLQVTRSKGDPHGAFPDSVVKLLQSDSKAAKVLGRYETDGTILDSRNGHPAGFSVDVTGVRRPDDNNVDNLKIEKGKWFESTDGNYAVIDQMLAEKLHVDIGGEIALAGTDHSLKLKVTGIVHKPTVLAAEKQEVYVPLKTLQDFVKKPGKINRVLVTLKPGSDIEAFKTKWEPQVQKIDPLLAMKSANDLHQQLEHNMEGMRFLAYLGGAVSLLAAMFIVFSALSMGVGERQRTLAMLRAIGALKSQLAKLVISEGLILSVIGAAVGVPLGLFWVKMLATLYPDFFVAGVVPDWWGIGYGSLGSILTALVAGILPAWSASSVDPVEAMAPLAAPRASRLPIIPTIAGLLLIAIDPALIFGGASRTVMFYGHFIAGLPGMMLGFFLLAPFFVWLCEKLFGFLAAKLMGVQPALLRQQLSSGIWRAAGTCAALMVGLAILIVMQSQGRSMLSAWQLPTHFPDVFIWSAEGLTPDQQHRLAHTPGIRDGQLMPVIISGAPVLNVELNPTGTSFIPEAAMFFGVDPDLAYKMIELDFRDDNGKSYPPDKQKEMMARARDELKLGKHIIITDEYRRLLGKKRGDTLTIQTPLKGPIDFKIIGVCWSPGVDVIVTMFDMERQFDQRTAASIFGCIDDARKYFGVANANIFAANIDYGMDKVKLQDLMTKEAQRRTVPTTAPATTQAKKDDSLLGHALGVLGVGGNPSTTQSSGNSLFGSVAEMLGMQGLKVGDVRQIKYEIETSFNHILLLLSTIAFASMAVAALGVTNTVMSSIRSRKWQFGILRSIGVTRGQLLRLVLAEALLLAITASALGLALGAIMSIDANGLSKDILGVAVTLHLAWSIVGLGMLIVLGTALIASAWPAISVAYDEPLALLQAGRAAG